MEVTSITDLHVFILLEIFCLLPAKFINRCRCVCKDWANLICQPYFPYEYLSRGKAPLQFVLEKNSNLVLVQLDESLTSYFSIPSDSVFDLGIRRILSFPSPFPIHTGVSLKTVTCQVTGWIIVVLYPDYKTGELYDYHLYNPITGQHIVVQKPKPAKARLDHAWREEISCALVIAEKTNQLKFLEFCDGKADIQTIGTNAWRSLGEVYQCDGQPILLNGHCHWLNDQARVIISFDAEEEVFQVIHTLLSFHDYKWCNLGLLDGCLCVCLISSDYVLELWVMNEYGIRDTWTKKFGLLEPLSCLKNLDYVSTLLEPLACLKSGEILLLAAGRTMHVRSHRKSYPIMIAGDPHSRKYRYVLEIEFR